MPEMPPAGPYLAAFELLQEDFRRLGEYVELNDANLDTFSHRLYELLLRTCTEFESLCRDLLVFKEYEKEPRCMKIHDYKKLEGWWQFESKSVGFLRWMPEPCYVSPFQGWSTASPPLSWYDAYNAVKHNRHAEFKRASLKNVCNAIAGQFVLIVESSLIAKSDARMREQKAYDGRREYIYPGFDFSFITPG
jgi:hypothetical protein